MYTGIITKSGQIISNTGDENGHKLHLKSEVAAHVSEGDSVGINGVCLTVTSFDEETVCFDVWPESLKRTTLKSLIADAVVHVDLPLKQGEFIGGHNILGHVDFVAKTVEVTSVPGSDQLKLWFELPAAFASLVPARGSVAVDGVSLTITDRRDDAFSVSLIPETLSRTHLNELVAGDLVNIEVDYNARQLQDDCGVLAMTLPDECYADWKEDTLEWSRETLKKGGIVLVWDEIEKEVALVSSCAKLTPQVLIFAQSLARTPLMVALDIDTSERLAIPAPVINHPIDEEGRRYLLSINHPDNREHDYSAAAILKTLSLFTDPSKAIGDWKCPGNVASVQVYCEFWDHEPANLEAAVKLMASCELPPAALCMPLMGSDGVAMNKEQAEAVAARFVLPLIDLTEALKQ